MNASFSKLKPDRPKTAATEKTSSGVDMTPLAGIGQSSATRVLRRFRVVFNTVKSHFREIERLTGVGGAQLWALSVIADAPGVGVSALATAMDIKQSTASNLVKSLIASGYVVQKKGQPDRRTTSLTASASGLAVLQHAPGPFSGVLPDALVKLDPAILERLDRDLGALIETLEADMRAANIPLADL